MRRPELLLAVVLVLSLFGRAASTQSVPQHVALPNKEGSLKFAVLGNSGTGEQAQSQLAEQMATFHQRFKFDLVVLTGGNISGAERPQDYLQKFETPYKPLLDAGAKFQAALGPNDSPDQKYYKLFNMGGRTYYTFSPSPDVTFFSLESSNPTPDQIQWLEQELQASKANWKIAFFHHSLYSKNGDSSNATLRNTLEPLLAKYNVAVVLSGQGRAYERLEPQKGVAYMVVGPGEHFLAAEIIGDEMFFMAISRDGKIVDAGAVRRRALSSVRP